MNCYQCDQDSVLRPAIALCHHCSAGLCGEHVFAASRDVTTIVPLGRVVVLPVAARQFLCHVCKQALEQPRRVA